MTGKRHGMVGWLAVAGVVWALAACGGGGGADSPAGVTPPTPVPAIEYFPLAVGDRWVYQGDAGPASVDVRATQTVGGRSVFVVRSIDSNSASDDLYEKTGAGIFLVAPPGADALDSLLDGVPVLRLPFVAGSSETVVDRALPGIGDLDGDGVTDSIQVRVVHSAVGLETVSTPLGSYANAAHVRTVVTQTVALSVGNRRVVTTLTSDDWYAPGVGPVRNEITVADSSGTVRETLALQAYRAGTQRSEGIAPTLLSTTLVDGAVASGLGGIGVNFSEPMFVPSLNEGGFVVTGANGQPVDGRLSPALGGNGVDGSGGRNFVFNLNGTVPSGIYTAQVTALAQDLAGNGVATPRSWRISVDASGPRVQSSLPADGAADVAAGSGIVLVFDEPPVPSSLPGALRLSDNQTGGELAYTLAHDGARVTITPATPLLPRRQYTVSLGPTVRDALGNMSGVSWSASFRTDPGRFGYVNTFDLAGSGVAYESFGTGTVAFGDVDGDGRGDLLVTPGNVFTGTGIEPNVPPPQPLIWVWRMNADGSLRAPLRVEPPANHACRSPALAVLDINGDGRLDVVAGSDCGLVLYQQGPDGQLSLREVQTAPPGLLRLRAADMNGDGRTDLVGIGWSGDAAWLWLQRPEGGFGAPVTLPVRYFGWTSLALGDFSGDGRPDIAIAGANSFVDTVAFLRQNADGSYGPATYGSVDPQAGAQGVAVGDLNGDGRADVLAGSFSASAPGLTLFRQQADGSLAAPLKLPGGSAATAITLADMNNDGRLDVVVSYEGYIVLYEQQADGSLGPRIDIGSLGGNANHNPQALLVADLNGDGLLDVVLNQRYVLQRPAGASASQATPQVLRPAPAGPLRALRSVSRALRPAPAPATSAR